MSAIALNVEILPLEVLHIFHEVVREQKGIIWANALVGNIGLSSSSEDREYLKVSPDSLEDCTCIKCYRQIEEHEELYCLYEYEDGEPAFYLCPGCEAKATFEDFDE